VVLMAEAGRRPDRGSDYSVERRLTPLEPQPSPGEIPAAFPSPFDELGPHPLARRAALALQAEFGSGWLAPGVRASTLEGPEGGKMFGVLVVRRPDGEVGFLRSFSGMLDGRWDVEGFVPPIFDREARARVEPAGDAEVAALMAREKALRHSPELSALRAEGASLEARHAAERARLDALHDERRGLRHARRAGLAAGPSSEEARRALHALAQESRVDQADLRRLKAEQLSQRQAHAAALAEIEGRLSSLEQLRLAACREFGKRLHDTYAIPNARGERRPMRSFYADVGEPPGGAADCAGPKLLAFAFVHGLRPLALAEFWWGRPPVTGGRVAGGFYPACKRKSAPLLPYMLEGIEVAPAQLFVPAPGADDGLRILFEDEWIVLVDKPCGLLSVPGRAASLADSVLTRLRARHPRASGPLLVHRLDLDTSGLLLAALDPVSHKTLQRQFLRREVRKRYVAWVEGAVRGERGVVDLPMHVDLHDRPRQIYGPVHGKPAVTEWQVLERRDGRTRLALFPLTGRTHQLRVHASHPLGLGAPIVGDRLYGHAAERLQLHAEAIAFAHPKTGERLSYESPAPF
jgi:tRNA pseudouridine32 synthase/23S rRNA pseudouridine746 synthase